MSDDRNLRTSAFWDAAHERGDPADEFLQHPLIHVYASLRAFGDTRPHMQALLDEIRARTAPGARLLSIGCGAALKERDLCRLLPDRMVEGIDLAATTLARVRSEVEAEGLTNLTLSVGDFNQLDLPADAYDLVLGLGALHHVEALEEFWPQCAKTLRPGGVLIAQEYIGAARFQWTDAQLEHGNRALETLIPEDLRGDVGPVQRVPLAHLIEADPSEAVRSDEILDTCRAAGWHLEEYRGGGGGLLQPTLHHRLPRFSPTDWRHNRVLFELFAEEDRLLAQGIVGDTYAMFVAQPPR